MHPYLQLALLMTAFLADIGLCVFIGHRLGLSLWRRKRTAVSRLSRLATNYIPWSIAAGLMMCTAILVTNLNFIIALGLIGPMAGMLMVADALEPPRKTCTACGH